MGARRQWPTAVADGDLRPAARGGGGDVLGEHDLPAVHAQGVPAISITYVGGIASLLTILPVWVLFGERIPLDWAAHWWQFGLMGVVAIGAAQALNIAYRSAPAAVVGSLEYVAIIFATRPGSPNH